MNITANKNIWFDLDGTIVDLYGTSDWMNKLNTYNPAPYIEAKPLLNMSLFARYLNKLQREGYQINIVSWLSKTSNEEFDNLVTEAKNKWLNKHLASVHFNIIDIIPYGTPKEKGRSGILFDDELRNRTAWGNGAFDVDNIIGILKQLI